jgi:amino acid adenylation domain-containing protein
MTSSEGTADHPLTRSQSLIWQGQALLPDAPIYNMASAFEINAPLDPAHFEAAFDALTQRHECLRTVVRETDGVPHNVVLGRASGSLERHQMVPEAASVWISEATRARFDLTQETFRAALIDLGNGRSIWFLNLHHLVTDAASVEILFNDLSALYAGFAGGAPASLEPPVPASAALPRSADPDDAKAPPAPLPKLFALPRSGSQGDPAAHMHVVPLGAAREKRLADVLASDDFAALSPQQSRFNLFSTVLTVWLARLARIETPTIGVVTHGRPNTAARQAAGCFVEVFPFATKIAPTESFRTIHDRVAESAFDFLRAATPGTSSAEGQRGFNVVLNLIQSDIGDFAGYPTRMTWLQTGATDPQHAVRLNVMDFAGGDGIELGFLFNLAQMPAALHAPAAEHFLTLLDGFLDDPDQIAMALPLGGPNAQAAKLTEALDPPSPALDVVAGLHRQAQDAPTHPAIHADQTTWDRQTLLTRATQVAMTLDAHGIKPGARVGVHLTRTQDLPATQFGILIHGSTFVPLDPGQPAARLVRIAELAGLQAILSEEALEPLKSPATRILTRDITGTTPEAYPDRGTNAPAYVIFTSGTSGIPKGVVISRAALSRYAQWAHDIFAKGHPLTWAVHSAIGFDLTITSIFAPLAHGGAARFYRDVPGTQDLSILTVFEDDSVDVVKLTPAHLAMVVAAGGPVSRITHLVLGGEDLPTALARKATETLGSHIRILNEYGPTEATVGCMIHEYAPGHDLEPSVPIGAPATDTRAYVLDAGLNPVPDEVVGELYISGHDRLADGYLNDVDETAEKFTPDPFAPGRQMYRTGDLASLRADGVIRYHGRQDAQLSLGGIRVEPEEIRQAALSHPGVGSVDIVMTQEAHRDIRHCRTCGIGSDQPEIAIGADGDCALCRDFGAYQDRAAAYFSDLPALEAKLAEARARATGKYDCIVLLSGGKDSTYALGRMAALSDRILTLTLDNGFISEGAKENIARVTNDLGVDHRFLTTEAMNDIFVDSLRRHSNVCQGCFKTIYTLALNEARAEGVAMIVTGLSRGQLFETRLAPELFGPEGSSAEEIDAMVVAARKSYHRTKDAVTERLNGDLFHDDQIFDDIAFVDFYRYCDVSVSEIYAFLDEKLSWYRPKDTGRSTNCLINDVGIHVHKNRRGFHNYALPYSWDVRLGHKTRAEARDELDDEIDEARVLDILDQIGLPRDEAAPRAGDAKLACYYTSADGVSEADLRRHLEAHLPRGLVPKGLMRLDALPMTQNGKVDRDALPPIADDANTTSRAAYAPPQTEAETVLAEIWGAVLKFDQVGRDDNFYDLGGDSIAAIKIAAQAARKGWALGAADIFRHQTLHRVAAQLREDHAVKAPPAAKRAQIDTQARDKLAAMFGKRPG